MSNIPTLTDLEFDQIQHFYDNNWSLDKEKKHYVGWGYEQKRLQSTIFEFLALYKPKLILEIGCGKGDLTFHLSNKYPNVIAIDISLVGIKRARDRTGKKNNCEFLMGDVTLLPFCCNKFDMIVFSEVLEHTLNQNQSISEIFRVLHPKGKLIITTPNSHGFYRRFLYIFSKLIKIPLRNSSQIFDNPLSVQELDSLLNPFFLTLKKRGLIFSIPYITVIKIQCLLNFVNTMSEFIENHNYLPNYGLYQCYLCSPRPSINVKPDCKLENLK